MVEPVFDVTDLTRVKAWMREEDSGGELDGRISSMIGMVSAYVDRVYLANALCRRQREWVVPSITYGSKTVTLPAAPVHVGIPVEVWYDLDGVFPEGLTALATTEYTVDHEAGLVRFHAPIEIRTPGRLKIRWHGGMAADLADLDATYPDIVHACTMWVADWVRSGVRLQPQVVGQGEGARVLGQTKVPAAVLDILSPYRRRRFRG